MEQEVGGSSPPNCTNPHFAELSLATVDRRDTCAVACSPPVLANPDPFTHNSAKLWVGGWMTIFRAGNFRSRWLLATALALSIFPAAAQTYTPEQEQACTGDAFRLCSSEIPDVGSVTACMVAKKSQLSPPCRAQFRPDPEPPEAAARPAGRRRP